MNLFLAAEDPLSEVIPQPLFHIGPLVITNHMLMAVVVGLLMLWIFPRLFKRPDGSAPSGAKNFFESILEFFRVEVFRPALKEHTDAFTPFLWTLFFFILFCNLLGCIPFPALFELLTGGRVQHLGGSPTASISTTLVLAVCAFVFIHFHGIDMVARSLMDGTYGKHGHHDEHSASGHPPHESSIDLDHMRGDALAADVPADLGALTDPTRHYRDDEYIGPHEKQADEYYSREMNRMTPAKAILLAVPLYLWNFAPHPFRPAEGESKLKWLADIPMFFIMLLPLELLGAVIKPFALCMRLFGNMVSGHIVLAVLIGLIVTVPVGLAQIAVGVPLGFLDLGIQLLEIFVAFLQAYIFVFLTTLFIASAVAPEH
jgi:F0F1-type ATP synthase membrane subunit a